MATTTNYGWTTPDDTSLVKDGASAIRSLGSAIDTTVFNNAGAAIAKTIVDAKGDIIAATAADTISRLAVGANDTVLTADSSTATGLKWATPSSGGMTLISEQSASASTSIVFSSIPGTYKQIFLIWGGLYTSDNSDFALRINNDSGSNYMRMRWGVAGGSFTSASGSATSIYTLITNATSSTDIFSSGMGYLLIDNYSSTTKTKRFNSQRTFYNGNNTAEDYIGIWNSTSAITSLDIVRTGGTGTFTNMTNTSIRLYGVS
jgi:hypothetical protein